MNFWQKIFRNKASPPKAMAFVDYEYWFYSFKNQFGLKPDAAAWRNEIAEEYDIADIFVFANFGVPSINNMLTSLRTITNSIIETRQAKDRIKKDMTDFIMLDYIYQTASLHPEIEVFILFTGDGHFQSVTKYLTQRLKKTVVVYGIRGTVSSSLQAVATKCVIFPSEAATHAEYMRMIVSNMDYVSRNPRIIPSFNGTVEAVSRHNDVPEEMIRATLREMLDSGLLVQKEHRVDFNRKVRVITADWDALKQAGLWPEE